MGDFDNIIVRYSMGLGYGADVDESIPLSDLIDREIWEDMSESERTKFLDDVLETEIQNRLDVGIWLEW